MCMNGVCLSGQNQVVFFIIGSGSVVCNVEVWNYLYGDGCVKI